MSEGVRKFEDPLDIPLGLWQCSPMPHPPIQALRAPCLSSMVSHVVTVDAEAETGGRAIHAAGLPPSGSKHGSVLVLQERRIQRPLLLLLALFACHVARWQHGGCGSTGPSATCTPGGQQAGRKQEDTICMPQRATLACLAKAIREDSHGGKPRTWTCRRKACPPRK